MMNKNNDMNAKKVMRQKLQVNLDMNEVAEAMERAINQLPILTEAEVDELRDASNDMLNRMVDKGCWLGLGFVRKADQDLGLLSAAHGNFSTLALMVAEAMDEDPVLEKVFLMALALKKGKDMTDATEDNEDNEDNNEEEE